MFDCNLHHRGNALWHERLYFRLLSIVPTRLEVARMAEKVKRERTGWVVRVEIAATTYSVSSCSGIRYPYRSEEHTSELQSRGHLVCRLLLEKKNKNHHST